MYVDDLLVTGPEQHTVNEFFGELASLSVKDLGRSHKCLRKRVNDDVDGYELAQEDTITDLPKDHRMELARGVRPPIGDECNEREETAVRLLPVAGDESTVTVSRFQSLLGGLVVASEMHEARHCLCSS
ncbi:hypothetical protein PC128_g17119 [Phytophthora cactorum]|nr:hypothetical protein PC120_g14173 [Phytophthora cactorum]KAG3056236.1 hypothetical protein PC121_g15391 [Phytophthora cactorum]KAG3176837.1 hypothetical protein PC128_g17119 [Phytophthora cactorum]KAG4046033.1 hypothetical protein PC123_g18583 [Phytophthora cactorum]